MKKILLFVAATAGLLLAGSCQRENLEPVQQGGTVTYTIQVPGDLATKATGDGFTLYYEVYRLNELVVSDAKPVYKGSQAFSNGSADVKLEFVKNQKFTVLFWAQKTTGAQAYNIEDLRKVSLETLVANDASAEVFAGKDEVDNCVSEANGDVELVRPVAQLNIATTAASLTLGSTPIVPTESKVTVDGLYGKYNVATGAVDTKAERIYAEADVPGGDFKGGAYKLMATNFLGFIPKEGDNVEVKFTIFTQNDGQIEHTVSNVPVKPNYQTNILGNLISATADYNVTLGAWETPETNVQVVSVSTAQDLQEAIDNIPTGSEGNIILEGNIDLGALAGMISTKAAAPAYGLKIPADKSLVLDLNGNTLAQTVNCTASYSMIENHGSLTIIDSKGEGKISFKDSGAGDSNFGWGSYTITNRGNLVVNGGTIEHTGEQNTPGNVVHMYCAIQQASGTTTINGGKICTPTYRSVRVNNGQIFINGGVFEGQVWMQPFAEGTALTITGGRFSPTGGDYSSVFVDNGTKTVGLAISGGNFTTKLGASNPVKGVTGGTFAVDPSAFLVDGYVAVLENEVYVVYKAVAAIGETKYKSIEDAIAAATAENEVVLLENIQVAENTTIKIEKGKTLNLDLNEKTLSSTNTRTATHNDFINVQGTLNVKDGTITYEHAGDNMAWNGCTNLLNVTAGGVVNMTNVVAENLGGTDMNFAAHLNNWGSVTVNAENCEFLSTYCGFRVFNSGYDVNDVTIKNSKFTGASRAFWVHNYIGDLNSTQHTDAAITARLKLDIYNNGNTFEITGTAVSPIRYGFGNTIYFAENGSPMLHNAASLKWFANEVNERKNSFDGKTVKLVADIDLNNEVWTPIGQTGATTFNGVFDGQNYTISNLNVNSEDETGAHYSSGLFGWVESHTADHGHIKNVKISGATVIGHHNCGALVGYITQETALVENCHVTGATITCTKANNDADGDKAGALIGNATVATPVKNCTAANSTVSAGRDAGQVIGAGKEVNVTGCSATDVTVEANGTGTGANVRNEVIGRLL